MEKQFTLETRLSLGDDAKAYLTEYMTFYNEISRQMWQIVKKANFKERYTRSDFNTYVCNRYNVLKRTANSIYNELIGKKNSLLELMKTEFNNKKIKYEVLIGRKEKLVEKINKLKAKAKQNLATDKELIRYRKYKHKYYFLCNRINRLKQSIDKTLADIKNKNVSMGFGTKKAFKAQYDLEANKYSSHAKWKNEYVKKRDKIIFYLGSKDETNGNQLAQISYDAADDTFSLKLRKEKKYSSDSKYLEIPNIKINYMKKELIDIINNQINKTNLLPLSYRIIRKNKKWYLQIIITTIISDYYTRKEYGVIGLDYNDGFITLSETNETGNLVKSTNYNLKYHGCGNKALNEILNVINDIVSYARSVGKDISIEDLDFKKTKSKSLKASNKKYNKMIHSLDYKRYKFRLENKCHKMKVSLNMVNPYNTSKIGYEKYAQIRKMTKHQAASFVIARRHQGYID